jgi:hypothetical protein
MQSGIGGFGDDRGRDEAALEGGMKLRWTAVAGAAALFLVGCVTDQASTTPRLTPLQQASYDYFVSEGMDKNYALVLALNPKAQEPFFDDKKCRSYGAAPGSSDYITCRSQLEAAHQAAPR